MGSLELEATELRLGLPGGGSAPDGGVEGVVKGSVKRRHAETIDLKLKLHHGAVEAEDGAGEATAAAAAEKMKRPSSQKNLAACSGDADSKPPAPKAQVVGWPPVRSFRKNIMVVQSKQDGKKSGAGGAFVKVSMDGAPYLRKVDLKMYKSYQELSMALEKMFGTFTSAGNCDGFKDFMNENKLMDLLNGSDYVPTYEDKDGDWMLVGDVPWEMFVESCKRLRIMKGSEATGLAPRAMEKCKNRC